MVYYWEKNTFNKVTNGLDLNTKFITFLLEHPVYIVEGFIKVHPVVTHEAKVSVKRKIFIADIENGNTEEKRRNKFTEFSKLSKKYTKPTQSKYHWELNILLP